jgi:hypothetical protein
MKGWDVVGWKGLLSIIGVLRTWSIRLQYIDEKSKHTLSKPRKVLTHTHSLLVSLSSQILSRLVESCLSHRSSSMKVAIHCGKQLINIIHSYDGIWYTHLFFFPRDQASNMSMTTEPSYPEWVEVAARLP